MFFQFEYADAIFDAISKSEVLDDKRNHPFVDQPTNLNLSSMHS